MSPPIALLIAAGGTGGHLYPGLALAQGLRERFPGARLLFVGAKRLEATTIPKAGFPLRSITVHGLAGGGWRGLGRKLRSLAELAIGLPLWQSLPLLRQFRPDVVAGTGGYVSGPVLAAAWLCRIPTLVVDGNRRPGLSSRLLARIAAAAAVAGEESARAFRAVGRRGLWVEVVGNPIRPALLKARREEAIPALGLEPGRRTLLAVGGSIGAPRLNQALVGALRLLAREGWFREQAQVLHLTGRGRGEPSFVEEARRLGLSYQAREYLEEMELGYAGADLVLCRGGAATLAEITALGLPAIIVPWSGASQGEQAQNAAALAAAGAAVVIRDQELTEERLAADLTRLLRDEKERGALAARSRRLGRPEATERVIEMVLTLVARKRRS